VEGTLKFDLKRLVALFLSAPTPNVTPVGVNFALKFQKPTYSSGFFVFSDARHLHHELILVGVV